MSESDDKEGINEVTEGHLEREMDRLLAEIDPTKIPESEAAMRRAAREVTTKFRKCGAAVHISTQNIDDIDEVSVARFKRVLRKADEKLN